MTFFTLLIPASFVYLALAHLVALLSPGPDFFLITGYAARYRFKGSAGLCVGIACGNAIYIALAILGWNGIRDFPALFSLIGLAGGCYLLWIGYALLRSGLNASSQTASQTGTKVLSLFKQFSLGLASALLNPKNMLFYLTLMTTILGSHVTLPQQIFCGVWMTAVVLFWDLLLVMLMSKPAVQRKIYRIMPVVEGGAGLILIGFGLFTCISLLFQ